MDTYGNSTADIPIQTEEVEWSDQYFTEPFVMMLCRLALEASMATMGVAGNILVIFLISVRPKLCTVVNNHIRNLAVADLCFLTISFPLAVIKEQDPFHWPLGETICRYFFPLSDVFFGVSVWSIAAIAVDRYRAIVWGCRRSHACNASVKSAKWVSLAIWITSFVVISLPLYFVMEYWEMFGLSDCTPFWPDSEDGYAMQQCYVIGTIVFWYIIPLAISIFAYVQITRKIQESTRFHKIMRIERTCTGATQAQAETFEKQSKRETKMLKSQQLTRREKHNAKAVKLLAPVVLVFAITGLPLNVFRLALLYYPLLATYKYLWLLYNIVVMSLIANSSLNPLIYSIVSEDFRQGFKSTLTQTRSRLRTFSGSVSGLQKHKKKLTVV